MRKKLKAIILTIAIVLSTVMSTGASKAKTENISSEVRNIEIMSVRINKEESDRSNCFDSKSNSDDQVESDKKSESISNDFINKTNLDDVELDYNPKYNLTYNLNVGKEDLLIDFKCKFKKIVTNNAYNGIIIAYDISTNTVGLEESSIRCVFETTEYLDRMQIEHEPVDAIYNRNTISFSRNKNVYSGNQLLEGDFNVLQLDINEYITESDGEAYLEAISIIRGNSINYSYEEKEEETKLWSAEEGDFEEFVETSECRNSLVLAEQTKERNQTIMPLKVTPAGTEARNIVNDNSWFTTTGKSIKKIPASRRVCIRNSGYIGNTIYTDLIILEYVLSNVSHGTGSHTASMRLKILYNITITYNNGKWDDLGANSSAMAVRNATVGIKTVGTCNNDFFYKVVQGGEYHTASGSSPVEEVLRKLFYKVIPHGGYVMSGVDAISDFIMNRVGDYGMGFGTIDYDDDRSAHLAHNGGYVRSALMNSSNYSLYKNSNYQRQEVYIKKSESRCVKRLVYQSHFEILGAYSGYETIYNSSVSFQQDYS